MQLHKSQRKLLSKENNIWFHQTFASTPIAGGFGELEQIKGKSQQNEPDWDSIAEYLFFQPRRFIFFVA
jgi:hypothetical protein